MATTKQSKRSTSAKVRGRKSAPISIRLSPDAYELVEEEAKRTRRSRSSVVSTMTEEAAKSRLFPGIFFMGPDGDRRANIRGTGFDVWQMIETYRDFDESIERILKDFNLEERHIHLALAYYERFPEEIDSKIAANNLPIEEMKRLYPFIEGP